MALAPTLYDFDIALSLADAGVERRLQLKTARHPSESLPRVWLRVLAYCIFHEERLEMGPGLSDPDAPDLRATDLTGRLTRFIRVGRPEPAKVLRELRGSGGARVAVLFDSPPRLASFVGEAEAAGMKQLAGAELVAVDDALVAGLAKNEARRTKLSVTLVADHLYIQRGDETLEGPLTRLSVSA